MQMQYFNTSKDDAKKAANKTVARRRLKQVAGDFAQTNGANALGPVFVVGETSPKQMAKETLLAAQRS